MADLIDTSNATATPNDILLGKTAYAKDEKVKGTIPSKLGGAFMPTTEPQIICPAGVYTSSAFSVRGDANLIPKNIKSGVSIFGVEGSGGDDEPPKAVLPSGMCTITVAPDDYTHGSVFGGGVVSNGLTVTVTAKSKSGYKACGWKENETVVSEDAEYTFQATESRHLVAIFLDESWHMLPNGYKEVEWIQNADEDSYISLSQGYFYQDATIIFEFSLPEGGTTGKGVAGTQVGYSADAGSAHPGASHLYTSTPSRLSYYQTQVSPAITNLNRDFTIYSNLGTEKVQMFASGYAILVNDTLTSLFVTSKNSDGNTISPTQFVVGNASFPTNTDLRRQIIRIYHVKSFSVAHPSSSSYNYDYIPCVDPKGVVGLYDIANGVFRSPSAGSFIAGPVVHAPNYYNIVVTVRSGQESYGKVTGGGRFYEGQKVTISATNIEDGYRFVGWQENGQIVNKSTSMSFIAQKDRNLVAQFELIPVYTITAVADPADSGTVTGAGQYREGENVVLTATNNDDCEFLYWEENGEVVSGSSIHAFPATKNTTLVAKFRVIPVYSISASVDPEGSGSVTGQGEYRENTEAMLLAEKKFGWKFDIWEENGTIVSDSNPYQFIVSSNRNLIAKFEPYISRLPDGYTEVEYIQSSGNGEYIDTSVAPSTTLIIKMDVEPTATNNQNGLYLYFFNSHYSLSNKWWAIRMCWLNSGISGVMAANASNLTSEMKVISSNTTPRRVILELDETKKTVSVDGVSVSFSSAPNISANPIYLLSSGTSTGGYLPAKLYSCQIYKGTNSPVVRDFVPCKKDSSGEAGLYDLVNNQFYTSEGDVGFTAGPEV